MIIRATSFELILYSFYLLIVPVLLIRRPAFREPMPSMLLLLGAWMAFDFAFMFVRNMTNINQMMYSICIFEFAVISRVFYLMFKHPYLKFLAVLLFIVYAVLWVMRFSLQDWKTFPDFETLIECVLIVILCAVGFLQYMYVDNTVYIEKDPYFWFLCSMFLYFGAGIFVFGYRNFFIKDNAPAGQVIWRFQMIMNTLHAVLLIMGISQVRKAV